MSCPRWSGHALGGFAHLADLDAAIWTRFGSARQPAYAFVYPDGGIEIALNERGGKLVAS